MCGRSRAPHAQQANLLQAAVNGAILHRRAAALRLAARPIQLAVHVDEAARARALVQVVHILRAQKKPVAELRLQLRQREMRRIRLRLQAIGAPLGVKLPYQRRILLKSFRRAHVLHPMPRPQPVRRAKRGQPALRADAGAGKDEDAVGGADLDLLQRITLHASHQPSALAQMLPAGRAKLEG